MDGHVYIGRRGFSVSLRPRRQNWLVITSNALDTGKLEAAWEEVIRWMMEHDPEVWVKLEIPTMWQTEGRKIGATLLSEAWDAMHWPGLM